MKTLSSTIDFAKYINIHSSTTHLAKSISTHSSTIDVAKHRNSHSSTVDFAKYWNTRPSAMDLAQTFSEGLCAKHLNTHSSTIDFARHIATVSAKNTTPPPQNPPTPETHIPGYKFTWMQILNLNLYREIPRNLSVSILWISGVKQFQWNCHEHACKHNGPHEIYISTYKHTSRHNRLGSDLLWRAMRETFKYTFRHNRLREKHINIHSSTLDFAKHINTHSSTIDFTRNIVQGGEDS